MALLIAILWSFFAPTGGSVTPTFDVAVERSSVVAMAFLEADHHGPLRAPVTEDAPEIAERLGDESEGESESSTDTSALDLGMSRADRPHFDQRPHASRWLIDAALRNVRSIRLRL